MPADAFDDDDAGEDRAELDFGAPLPPDDRIWRHPSEVGGLVHAARRRREITNGRLIGFALTASLLGSVVTVCALAAGGAFDRTVVERPAARPAHATVASLPVVTGGATWPAIVQRLAPSVARIEGSGAGNPTIGSAVAVRDDANGTYFATSLDLLHNVDRIELVLHGDRSTTAELVGTDQYTNLAVLKVPNEHVDPPDMAAQTEPLVGADAVVVGAPAAGTSSLTAAKALVGSLDNAKRAPSGIVVEGLLRTDANITPDTKGGAVLDSDGSVLGVVVLMDSDEAGVERFGYALPSPLVMSTVDSLIDHGFPTQVWLGISGEDVNAATQAGGARIGNTAPDSPASRCGLIAGDVVTKLNTTVIGSMSQLVASLRVLRSTDYVAIEFVRGGTVQSCYTDLSPPPATTTMPLEGPLGSDVGGAATSTPAQPTDTAGAAGAATAATAATAAPPSPQESAAAGPTASTTSS